MHTLRALAALVVSVCVPAPVWAQSDWTYIACDFEIQRNDYADGSDVVRTQSSHSEIFRFNVSMFGRYRMDTGGWDDLCRSDEIWHETECQITALQLSSRRSTVRESRDGMTWSDRYVVTVDRRTGEAYLSDEMRRNQYFLFGPGRCQPAEDPLQNIERRF